MRLQDILIAVLGICAAFLAGLVFQAARAAHPPPAIVRDLRPLVATVAIESWSTSEVRGVLRGSGRLVFGDRPVVPDGSGAFVIALRAAKPVVARVAASAGDNRFVASRRGKRYYPVGSAAGEKLSPKNRIYFATKEEAERAGYTAAD